MMINDIFDGLPQEFSSAIYADDCTLWLQGRDAMTLADDMQQALDSLAEWANMWGFTFTPSKCKAVFYSRYMPKRELENVPQLTLNNEHVPYAQSALFLGVYLDARLNLVEHVKYIRTRALKRVPLLKCLSGRGCGADRSVLLRIYKSLIRPILEYACQVMEGPSNKAVESLESIQNTCLRIATGALRTSPILPLQIETNVQPLYLRRCELSLRYVTKVLSSPNHPCHLLVDGSLSLPRVEPEYLKRIAGFPIYERIKRMATQMQIDIPTDVVTKMSQYPPWAKRPIMSERLVKEKKGALQTCEILQAFAEFRQAHHDFQYIYTDGSKTDLGVGCAFVQETARFGMKLSNQHSILTAEALGVLRAIQYAKAHDISKAVICTDSMSVVLAVQSTESDHPLIIEIKDEIHELTERGGECILLWIPGHSGIHGNEVADMCAKLAVETGEREPYSVSPKEYISLIRKACRNYFNNSWRNCTSRTNLKEIKLQAEAWFSSIRKIRREEIVLCRLRLGHTRKTHSYLLEREPRPECRYCNVYLTVRHLLLDCFVHENHRQELRALCQRHGVIMELDTLLGDSYPEITDAVFSFLRDSDLYKTI